MDAMLVVVPVGVSTSEFSSCRAAHLAKSSVSFVILLCAAGRDSANVLLLAPFDGTATHGSSSDALEGSIWLALVDMQKVGPVVPASLVELAWLSHGADAVLYQSPCHGLTLNRGCLPPRPLPP